MGSLYYDGLTSSYNKWMSASSETEEGARFDNVMSKYQTAQDLRKQGLIGTEEFRGAVDYFWSGDASLLNAQELKKTYDELNPLISDWYQLKKDGSPNNDASIKAFRADAKRLGDESIIEGDYGSMLIGGYLQSKNYAENNGVVTAGCKIDLNNFSIDSPNFKISLSGNVEMTGTLTVGSKVSMGSVYDENGTPLEDVLNTIGTSINLHSKDGQVFTESASVITPDSITVNAVCDGDVTVAKWLIDDVENTEYVAADKMSITIPSSYMASKKQIIVKAQNADGTVYDYITLCRLADGTNGTNGENGIGYTIALSNENHGFVADGDGIVQDEQIQIKASAWKNISAIATTVTIPELPTGMTATVSNNGTTNTYITIKVDNTLTDTQGTVEFGVTADSVNFVKAFSWSVNRGGKDGKPGTVYGIDSSSTSAVYNIRNSECTPSSGSFNAYYSEGDSKEKLPLDCYMQISYTSTGSTWIKYGDRLHCTNGTTAFNFLSTSHLDGLPVNTETGIITAVKCEIFATETSDTAYASKEITIVPSMNELAVLGFVEENNTIYVDGSNFYAGSIHTSALAAEVIKSIGCEYSSNSVYTTKGTYFDLATGVLASKNFAIDESGKYEEGKRVPNIDLICSAAQAFEITTDEFFKKAME